ncbi:MAG: hypothetical protein MHM6MM_002375 [Cercozoa sp. M6MM]
MAFDPVHDLVPFRFCLELDDIAARSEFALAPCHHSPLPAKFVLFGGRCGETFYGDTVVVTLPDDPTRINSPERQRPEPKKDESLLSQHWRQLPDESGWAYETLDDYVYRKGRPMARAGHSMTLVDDCHVIMFGGIADSSGKALNDTWCFKTTTGKFEWYKVRPSSQSDSHKHSHPFPAHSTSLFAQVPIKNVGDAPLLSEHKAFFVGRSLLVVGRATKERDHTGRRVELHELNLDQKRWRQLTTNDETPELNHLFQGGGLPVPSVCTFSAQEGHCFWVELKNRALQILPGLANATKQMHQLHLTDAQKRALRLVSSQLQQGGYHLSDSDTSSSSSDSDSPPDSDTNRGSARGSAASSARSSSSSVSVSPAQKATEVSTPPTSPVAVDVAQSQKVAGRGSLAFLRATARSSIITPEEAPMHAFSISCSDGSFSTVPYYPVPSSRCRFDDVIGAPLMGQGDETSAAFDESPPLKRPRRMSVHDPVVTQDMEATWAVLARRFVQMPHRVFTVSHRHYDNVFCVEMLMNTRGTKRLVHAFIGEDQELDRFLMCHLKVLQRQRAEQAEWEQQQIKRRALATGVESPTMTPLKLPDEEELVSDDGSYLVPDELSDEEEDEAARGVCIDIDREMDIDTGEMPQDIRTSSRKRRKSFDTSELDDTTSLLLNSPVVRQSFTGHTFAFPAPPSPKAPTAALIRAEAERLKRVTLSHTPVVRSRPQTATRVERADIFAASRAQRRLQHGLDKSLLDVKSPSDERREKHALAARVVERLLVKREVQLNTSSDEDSNCPNMLLDNGFFLSVTDLSELFEATIEAFKQEGDTALVDVHIEENGFAKVFGDVHGQYEELMALFDAFQSPEPQTGDLDSTKYVFLGDYVDRGKRQLECLALLCALKILYPERIFLLRGNHESTKLNGSYGFSRECRNRLLFKDSPALVQEITRMSNTFLFDDDDLEEEDLYYEDEPEAIKSSDEDEFEDLYQFGSGTRPVGSSQSSSRIDRANERRRKRHKHRLKKLRESLLTIETFGEKLDELYSHMPLSALLGGRILCMHGGIGKVERIDHIRQIRRPIVLDDLDLRGFEEKNRIMDLLWSDPADSDAFEGFRRNPRDVSVIFGADIVRRFCEENSVDLLVRAHQCVDYGIEYFAQGHLVTVFSAARYMGRRDNNGGILHINHELRVTPKIVELPP